MRSGSQRLALIACGALLVTVGATGCGRSGDDDLIAGKQQFAEKCGACHKLARANTQGIQGPDLDEAFGSARAVGMGQATVEGVVLDQIAHPRRGSIMKPGLVKGKDARDVAAYVAAVAAQKGKDEGLLATAGAPKVSRKPIPAEGGVLMMPADPSGALVYKSKAATAPPGSLKVESKNDASIGHDIALRDTGGKEIAAGKVVQGGGVSEFTVDLKPGKYEYVCTVPGHEDGGMVGTLTVK